MKDIVGYEGRYAVTPDGRVWSYPKIVANGYKRGGKFLVGCSDYKGYLVLNLYSKPPRKKVWKVKNFKIHRLVAQVFIPNPHNLPQINHKSGVKTDNRVENLEWCTNQQNRDHAVKNGLQYHKSRQTNES